MIFIDGTHFVCNIMHMRCTLGGTSAPYDTQHIGPCALSSLHRLQVCRALDTAAPLGGWVQGVGGREREEKKTIGREKLERVWHIQIGSNGLSIERSVRQTEKWDSVEGQGESDWREAYIPLETTPVQLFRVQSIPTMKFLSEYRY